MPIPKNSSSVSSKKANLDKCKVLKRTLDLLSCNSVDNRSSSKDQNDQITLFASFLQQNKELSLKAIELSDIGKHTRLSVEETVDLQVLLNLPTATFRNLRQFFQNSGIDILTSERKMIEDKNNRLDFLEASKLTAGHMMLYKYQKSEKLSPVGFVIIRDLVSYVKDLILKLYAKNLLKLNLDPRFKELLILKLGGDKGGGSSKITLQIMNCIDNNSRHMTRCISMFEATDSRYNCEKVFSTLALQIPLLENTKIE